MAEHAWVVTASGKTRCRECGAGLTHTDPCDAPPRPEPPATDPIDARTAEIARGLERIAGRVLADRDARIAELEAALRVAEGLVVEMIDAGRSHFTRGPRTRHWDEGLATVRAARAGAK